MSVRALCGTNYSRNWDVLRAELDTCILLCVNCDAEERDLAEKTRCSEA